MSERDIRIAVADDHSVIRMGLERLIAVMDGMTVVAQFADGYEVLQADLSGVDVLLLDLNMPGSDGIGLIEKLAAKFPALKIVVFSMLPEQSFASRALGAGAAAFLNKNRSPEEVVAAIQAVAMQKQFVPEAQQDTSFGETRDNAPLHAGLSSREFEILLLLARGQKPTDVAKQLGLKIGTVTTHVYRIKRKLGVHSIGDLVAYGHQHRLVEG